MNRDPQLPRYLCFTRSINEGILLKLKSLGAINPIIRKHTNCYEVDFRFALDPESAGFVELLDSNEILLVEENFSSLTTKEILHKSTQLIGEERFWECHNLLEELWKRNSGNRKKLVHDVIGVIVSQIKVQMGQWEVGKKVYERTRKNLEMSNCGEIVKHLPTSFTYPVKISLYLIEPMLEN